MHKRCLFIALILVFVQGGLKPYLSHAQCVEYNFAFKAGERVKYHAYYNWHFIWMNAGEVFFNVDKTTHYSKPAYKFTAIGTTYRGYDTFFKVRDTFVSVVDTAMIKPYLFHRKTNEGSYTAYESYRFDYDKKNIASSISKEKTPYVNSVLPLKDCTLDLLSMVYSARNIDFSKYRINEKIPIRMVVDGAIHDLYIRYLGKEQVVTRDKRKFNCLKFKPLLMAGTIFEAGEDMTVWVTDDMNRVPIVVEAKILIGSVKAMFVDITNPRYPLAAEVK
ncbi:MAG: DUF3108 domain-containing protein [Breznakibacter sp.]